MALMESSMGRRKLMIGISSTRRVNKEASQTPDYCIAKSAMLRAARPDPFDFAQGKLFAAQKALAQDDKSTLTLLRLVDLRQQVGLRFIAHEVRVALAAVVIEFVILVVVGVLHQEVKGSGAALAGLERVAQAFR